MAGPESLFGLYLSVPNLDSILDALEKNGTQLPNTAKAVEESTRIVQQIWQAYALGARVSYSGGTFVVNAGNGDYARSIQRQFPYRTRTSGLVFADSLEAERVEDGYGPFDMKPGLLRSPKAKNYVDRKGVSKRYITIPFRHNAPGADATGAPMPQNIYNQAKQLDFSMITGRNAWGKFTYAWGGSLGASDQGKQVKPKVGGMTAPYEWKTGPYSGMVRMKNTATGNSGGYITFRRVSSTSDPNSWWHPGVRPRPVTQAVIENAEPQILQLIRTGAALDLAMAGLPIPKQLR
jgi:hypothetical protein